MKRIDLKAAAQRVADAPCGILILTHENPDGDTLGSAFALWDFFVSRGRRASVVCPDEIGPLYKRMIDGYTDDSFPVEYIIAVDCAAADRTITDLPRQVDLSIDHHEGEALFARETLCLPNSASTAEIILTLFELLGEPLNKYRADCLYIGVSTDTGCFLYPNTTAATHIAAAKTIEAGASVVEINRLFFRTKSSRRVALERECLRGMKYKLGGRLLFFFLTREFLTENGIQPDDYEGLAAMPLTFEGVEVGVIIRAAGDENKVSMRSHYLNCAEICARHGGGGHIRAAGFETDIDFSKIEDALTEEIAAALERL